MICAITKRALANEDWKTQMARGYGNIPKGETVEVLEKVVNLYGRYTRVKWNGNIYYVDDRDLSYGNAYHLDNRDLPY